MDNQTLSYPHRHQLDWTTAGSRHQDKDCLQGLEWTYENSRPVFSCSTIGIGLFGILGNVLTLRVYAKMGFLGNTINISFMALAVSDLLCVLSAMMAGILEMEFVVRVFIPETADRMMEMVAGLPNTASSRTAALVTAWISLERCLALAAVSRVSLRVTAKVTSLVLVAIFILGVSPAVVVYTGFRSQWAIDPQTNSTVLTIVSAQVTRTGPAAQLILVLYGLVYPLLSWVSVAACTTVLVVTLRRRTRVHALNTPHVTTGLSMDTDLSTDAIPRSHLSVKGMRVTKIVIIVAGVYLLCSLPMSVQLVAMLTIPGYSRGRDLEYLCLINGMVCMVMLQVNSSINILIFYTLGKKFRSVLKELLSGWRSNCVY